MWLENQRECARVRAVTERAQKARLPELGRSRIESGTRIIEDPEGRLATWPVGVDQDLVPTQPASERPTIPPESEIRDTLPSPPPDDD